jgi:amino acid adenylation domain-containing protein
MKHQSIQQVFSRVAAQHASRVAVERGDSVVTYAEMENESNRLANFLLATGAVKGSIVAIIAGDPARIVTAMLGILKAGCAFAPFDPRMPGNRLKTMAEQIQPRWYVVESEHLGKVDEIGNEDGVNVVCFDSPEYAQFTSTTDPGIESEPDDLCSIFFTSGSTGKPKGIAGRLKGIAHFILWEAGLLGLEAGARISQFTSPSFDGFLKDVFVPLSVGGTICAPQDREITLDARRLVEWIEQARINVVHCVPSVFRQIINAGLASNNFPELRWVVMAGEPLLPADVARWTHTFGERIRLVNLYGPTETTLTKLFHVVQVSDKDRRSVPIGKPIPGSAAVVIDAQGKACPPGEVGEILIRTPYRAHGYYNQPELTAEVFVPNPLSNNPNDIVYRTGDYGRLLEDGNFEFVGRKDHQVKIRGVRIELPEIENLLRTHESVGDVAVVDREDAMGNKYLCAYVVLNRKVEPGEIKQHLAKSLPDFMMPSAIVELESLPHTANGKVDRKALPAPSADVRTYVAAQTAVEEVVASIWSQVLGIEQVGREDNFFDLGGHSLLATQVLSRVNAALQTEVPLRRLFEEPTVAQLSAAVEEALREGVARPPRIERVPRTEALPLSFAQQRLWFLDQLESGSAFYNVPAAVRLNGALDVEALKRALAKIVQRHEVLRTSFPTVDDQPVQAIASSIELPFDVIDLSRISSQEQEHSIASYAKEFASLHFDLAHGPLIRARLLRLGDDEHVLLFCMHHIVADLWSMSVLVNEWVRLYDAFSKGKPSPLEELPVQYADYAVWQREWLRGDVLAEQLDYWRKQLADAPAVLSLPTEKSRANHSFEGARLNVALPETLSAEIKRLSRREGTTLFMTLLAAFGATLNYHAQQHDILIGTPIANRRQAEVENLIGFFLNTLVLRLDLAGDPDFRELLRRVRDVSLGAYAHQDVPFEKLVEELRPERSLSHNPLFQVAFTLDQVPAVGATLEGLTLSPVEMDKGMVQFDLVLHLADTGTAIAGTLQYQTGLFSESSMQRLFRHFETVLAQVVHSPETKLSTLANVLDEAERQRLVDESKQAAAFSFEKLKTVKRQGVGKRA